MRNDRLADLSNSRFVLLLYRRLDGAVSTNRMIEVEIGGGLIQERLKQVIVAPVNQGNVNWRGFQSLDRGKASETTAYNDDFVSLTHNAFVLHSSRDF